MNSNKPREMKLSRCIEEKEYGTDDCYYCNNQTCVDWGEYNVE